MSEHPEVCVSDEKETNYFADKKNPWLNQKLNYHLYGIEGYERCFAGCADKKPKIYFEASPGYHFEQKTPFEAIPRIKPTPKIIFVLRKPSSRIYSFFNYVQNNMQLTDKDWSFADTVKYVLPRKRKELLKEDVFLEMTSAFLETCKYIEYLPAWFDAFGRGNVKVLILERMKTDRVGFMKELSEFVGVDPGFWDSYGFPDQNVTYKVKSRRLHKLASSLSRPIKNTDAFAFMKKIYLNMNTTKLPKKTESEKEVLKTLDLMYEPYNDRLAKYLNLDLSAWK